MKVYWFAVPCVWIVLSGLCATSGVGCASSPHHTGNSPDDGGPYRELSYTLADTTHELNPDADLLSLKDGTRILVADIQSWVARDVSVGDPLILDSSHRVPGGAIVVVEHIAPNESTVALETRPGTLADAFREYDLSARWRLTPLQASQSDDLASAQGALSVSDHFEQQFHATWTGAMKGYNYTGSASLNLDGLLSYDLWADAEVHLLLNSYSIHVEGDAEVSAQLVADSNFTLHKETTIISIPLVGMKIKKLLTAGFFLDLVGRADVDSHATLKLGASYLVAADATIEGHIQPFDSTLSGSATRKFTLDTPAFKGNVDATVGLGPQLRAGLSLLACGAEGGVKVQGTLNVKADTEADPWWTVWAGLEGHLWVEACLGYHDDSDDFIGFQKVLAQADGPFPCLVLDTCAAKTCYDGSVWCVNDCGKLDHEFASCGTAPCVGGACACSQTCEIEGCNGSKEAACFDNCGFLVEVIEQCADDEVCVNGRCDCIVSNACASKECMDGDVWCLSNCGTQTTKAEVCGGYATCEGGTCLPPEHEPNCYNQADDDGDGATDCADVDCKDAPACLPGCDSLPTQTICHSGNVWSVDGCGKLLEGIDDCAAKGYKCKDGACVCVPHDTCTTTKCVAGKETCVDECGYDTTQKACVAGCSNGHCVEVGVELDCGNGVDDDADALVDCDDPDCGGVCGSNDCSPACAQKSCIGGPDCPNGCLACVDGCGNVTNKFPCPSGTSCLGALACKPMGGGTAWKPEQCSNGVDDDGDGAVDCADDDCATSTTCGCPPPESCPQSARMCIGGNVGCSLPGWQGCLVKLCGGGCAQGMCTAPPPNTCLKRWLILYAPHKPGDASDAQAANTLANMLKNIYTLDCLDVEEMPYSWSPSNVDSHTSDYDVVVFLGAGCVWSTKDVPLCNGGMCKNTLLAMDWWSYLTNMCGLEGLGCGQQSVIDVSKAPVCTKGNVECTILISGYTAEDTMAAVGDFSNAVATHSTQPCKYP